MNPPQLGDFLGDQVSYDKCLGSWEMGVLAVTQGLNPDKDNPFDPKSDEAYWWKDGFFQAIEWNGI